MENTGSQYQRQYQQMEERALAAHHAFEALYAVTNPPPEMPRVSGITLTGTVTILALVIVVLAAMIVSGSRTIPEFGQVGVAAFFMLEVGSLVYAFRRAMHHRDSENKFSHLLVRWGLIICVVVMLAGNVDATLREHDIPVADWIKTIILLMVAISAPILTFIAGDILGIEIVAISSRREAAMREYEQRMEGWREAKMRSWDAKKAGMGVNFRMELEKNAPISIPSRSIGNSGMENDPGFSNVSIPGDSIGSDGMEIGKRIPSRSTLGHSKAPNASEKARAYFVEHPDALMDDAVDVVDLARKIGVGKSTLYKIRDELRRIRQDQKEQENRAEEDR